MDLELWRQLVFILAKCNEDPLLKKSEVHSLVVTVFPGDIIFSVLVGGEELVKDTDLQRVVAWLKDYSRWEE